MFTDGKYGMICMALNYSEKGGFVFMVIEYHEGFALRVSLCLTEALELLSEFDEWAEK